MSPELDGYRRNLVILICDLVGSTDLWDVFTDGEIVQELFDALRESVEKIVCRHGGETVQIVGDSWTVLFGHKASHEDSGRRATEAALDIHEAFAAIDATLAHPHVRILPRTTIHSGLHLVLPGDSVRGRFEMRGYGIAATAHVRADPGEILVSETTLGADRLFFRTGPRRLIIPEKASRPVAVYSVLGREPMESRFAARVRRGSAPFAGRRAELEALDAALDRCGRGELVVAALVGEAGIGKTRLAGEFLEIAAARGTPVHRGYCEAYLGARPLQPFAQLVRSLLAGAPPAALESARELAGYLGGMSARDLKPLIDLLSFESGGADEAPPAPEALTPALLTLILRAGGNKPLILSIDDWQWADDASRQLLELVAEANPAAVLVLLQTREEDNRLSALPGLTVVEVPPLSLDESRSATAALLTGGDPFRIERIARDAGGSPLFIEELCQAQPGSAEPTADADRTSWLNIMIQARYSRLPPELARLVRIAAVIGHIIPEWLFEAITGLGPADPALRQLAVEDFIYAGDVEGTLLFKHGTTRNAIYDLVGLSERKTLHGQVADALLARHRAGEDVQPEMLAYHCGACGDAENALEFAESAARKAMAAEALDRAQSHYRAAFEAIAVLPGLPDWAQRASKLVRRYGQACAVDPAPEQVKVLKRMAALSRDRGNAQGLALAQYWLGTIQYGLGDACRSIAHLEEALETVARLDEPRLEAQIGASLGRSLAAAADYPAATRVLDRAIPALRETGADSSGLAYTLCCRGFLLADQGRFEEAGPYYREADSIFGAAEPPIRGSYMTQMAAIGLWKGEWDRAIECGERGVRIAEHARTRYNIVMSRALAAYARWCRDRDPAAIQDLVRAAGWFMSGASHHRSSLLYGWLAETMAETGDLAAARSYAAQALRRARAADRLGEAMACRAMARIAAAQPGRRGAGYYLALAYRSAEARGSPREQAETQLCEAEIARAAGETERAAELAAEAEAAFAELGMVTQAARAGALRAGAPRAGAPRAEAPRPPPSSSNC